MAAANGERLRLEVADVRAEARDVLGIELRAPGGGALPPFEPGAHLEVDLPNGLVRHYSLVNDWRERERYVIGVARVAGSRGGSSWIHQSLRKGMSLATSAPRNNFRLDPSAERFLFIAGGIGITPIVSMVRWCAAAGRPWRLVYATRDAQRAAFHEVLREQGPQVQCHFDDERGAVLDVAPVLSDVQPGEHVYCCGPAPLMDAVRRHAAPLPADTVHFEYFIAPEAPVDAAPGADGFEVELRSSGQRFAVPADKSILEVLEAAGMDLPFSCREGLCGTCLTGVCAGEPEHRDYVLTQAERDAGRAMTICVSRAKSPLLVLDL